jgi:hypothetical protein
MPEKIEVKAYLEIQGRFRSISPQEKVRLQENVDRTWKLLEHKCSMSGFPLEID